MSSLATKARTALALGLPNLARVAVYKLGVRSGVNPVRRLRAEVPEGPFFVLPTESCAPDSVSATNAWQDEALYFGWWPLQLQSEPPDWHRNPFNGERVDQAEREWWQIPDFDPRVGDVKTVWEASRFDWVLALAQRVASGDDLACQRLNDWLADWFQHNPPYRGPNWKCGQEASIRVLHIAMSGLICQQISFASAGLLDLIELHLRRIAPTLSYAMAQDNNHGTSEAAALFVGGSWLASCGRAHGARWQRVGRRWLEDRAGRLIAADGSFSQHSVNYHRVMLDTFSMVEVWRRHTGLAAFSVRWRERAAAAALWLAELTDPESGDVPNLGANDGARLCPLSDTDYRDFRPSVQLAASLFCGHRVYPEDGEWNAPLRWLGVAIPDAVEAPSGSRCFDDGGYTLLRRGSARVLLRYPRFRFRPSHADALHLDLWVGGENHLRDGGTFSYNTDAEWLAYFPGTASHNTVQFDGRDQMPRLGRFLFGDWLKTSEVRAPTGNGGALGMVAAYRDAQGASHRREVALGESSLCVIDSVDGFSQRAVLRWRLRPGAWRLEENRLTDGDCVITVTSDAPIVRFDLVDGWESRYYLQRTRLPVLEVEIHQAGRLTTEYLWS